MMRRSVALLGCLLLAAACGGAGTTAPTTTSTPATSTATASPTAAPSPSPSPSPSPTSTALTSAKGAITVKIPTANARLGSPFTLSGDASVFEATLQWRLTDTAGRVIVSGITTASLGAPGRGTFTVSVTYGGVAPDTIAFVEVFSRSPKDGEIDEIVRLPVTLR